MNDDPIIIIHDEKKFDWRKSALNRAAELWNGGYSGKQIAAHFKVTMDEAFLLLMHLGENEMIEPRKGGWFG